MSIYCVILDCDHWAKEGECIANPNYLWSQCHTSCMSFAKDTDERCINWANEGECTDNANYIQLRCPESCGYALGWSVWARQEVGIADKLPFNEEYKSQLESCNSPADILGAAKVIKDRLEIYLSGGSRMISGLTSTSPSEYLGMLGLAEAVIYCLRLYEVSLKLYSKSFPHDIKTSEYLRDNEAKIASVTSIVGRGYSSDLLMRHLPQWLVLLHESEEALQTIADSNKDSLRASSFDKSACPPQVSHSMYDISKIYPPESSSYALDNHEVQPTIVLNNGNKMPIIGLGTWQLDGSVAERTSFEAIKQGYRHIDTAEAYRNEANIGWAIYHAIDQGIVTREELFIATKLSDANANGGYLPTQRLVQRQLQLLQVSYIDLYMLHSPFSDFEQQKQSWKALEHLVEEGTVKNLGLSNFNNHELEKHLKICNIKPVVIQNKADVYHVGKQLDSQGDDIVSRARKENIYIVAYSSFSAYPFVMVPLDDPVVKFIAKRHPKSKGNNSLTGSAVVVSNDVTPGQIILRWQLQHVSHNIFYSVDILMH